MTESQFTGRRERSILQQQSARSNHSYDRCLATKIIFRLPRTYLIGSKFPYGHSPISSVVMARVASTDLTDIKHDARKPL